MVATPLHQAEVRFIDEHRGNGVFATAAMPAGTVLFKEHSLVGLQHKTNKEAGPVVCERCFRFLGPLEMQMKELLRGVGGAAAARRVPAQLPRVDGMRHLPTPVLSPDGLRFCSEACRDATMAEYHRVICQPVAAPPADAMQVDQGASSAADGPGGAWA